MKTKYIIVGETINGNQFVLTKINRWCFKYPDVNESLWRFFDTVEEAREVNKTVGRDHFISKVVSSYQVEGNDEKQASVQD